MGVEGSVKDIFFLGAGFSRGLKPEMPLMNDLTRRVLDSECGGRWKHIGNVESILTYLSQEFPWEEKSFSLRKRADFLDISKIIGEIIRECQSGSFNLSQSYTDFFEHLHKKSSSVITLNYDELIESLFLQKGYLTSVEYMYPIVVTHANSRGGSGLLGGYQQIAPPLFKLHGSVNWYYSGSEKFFGETIYYYPPSGLQLQDHKNVADKVPLIAPPTFDKSTFMNNEALKSLWLLAKQQMLACNRLIFIGYSFPESDLMLLYFLKEAAANISSIIVVDQSESVISRVRAIFPDKEIKNCIEKLAPMDKFVREFLGAPVENSPY
jgi:hypothetical protein